MAPSIPMRLDVSFFDFDFRQQLTKNVHFGNIFETTTFEFLDISPYPENIHCALNRQVLDATTGDFCRTAKRI
jgi:hypothetical protein